MANVAVKTSDNESLYSQVFQQAVGRGKYKELVVSQALENYPEYKNILGDELALKFLGSLSAWERSFSKGFEGDKILRISTETLDAIAQINNTRLNKIFDIAADYLKNLAQDKWDEALSEANENLRLLLDLKRLRKNTGVGADKFRNPMRTFSKNIFSGNQSLPEGHDWSLIPSIIPSNSRRSLAKDILQDLEQAPTYDVDNIILYLGTILSDDFSLPFTEYPDITTQKIIIPCLNVASNTVIQLFQKYKMEFREAYTNSDASIKSEVDEVIQQDNEIHVEIATILGIKKKKRRFLAKKETSEVH